MKTLKKRYKIKSKLRFSASLLLLICLLIFSVIALSNKFASGAVKTSYEKVEVIDGDSLWEIAEYYKGEKSDIRTAVHRLQTANKMNSTELKTGSILLIPTDL